MPSGNASVWVVLSLALVLLASGCIKQPGKTVILNQSSTQIAIPQNTSSLWYLTRGGPNTDDGWAVTTDKDGTIYFADYETVPGPWADICLYRFSPDGKEIWKSRWGRQFNDMSYAIALDDDNVYVGGASFDGILPDKSDALITAFDKNGVNLWNFTFNQGYGYQEVDGLVVDGDYLYASGWTQSQNESMDLFVMKLDKNGNLIWKTIWGGPAWDEADGQMVVDNSSIYVSGRYGGSSILTGGKALLVSFDKNGKYLWNRTWTQGSSSDALGMTSDGTYLYLTGLTIVPTYGGQIFLIKYDKQGNEIWEQMWGGTGGESARTVLVDNESVYVVGQTDSYGAGSNDIVLLKYDNDGNLQWYKTWGGPQNDVAQGAAPYGEFIYIAGDTSSFGAGKSDALLIKADLNGTMPNPG